MRNNINLELDTMMYCIMVSEVLDKSTNDKHMDLYFLRT